MNAPVKLNPFLAGNFGPVRSEDDFADLSTTGEIPAALSGTFYRNGPNPQFEPRDPNHHWFAGDGMLHAFHVENGKVAYRNRYVRTPRWEIEHKAGHSLFGTFGNPLTTDPSVMGEDSGVANTNIVFHAGRLLALEEGHQPFEVDAKTLAPRGYREYAGSAKRFTAHPKFDPETGEMVFFGYMAGDMPLTANLAYGVVDAKGTVTRLDRFEAPFASMVHDFVVTRGHVVFPILPATLSLDRAMKGLPPIAWEPEAGAYLGVLARNAGIETLRWFKTDPNYVFHFMNAWEEGSKIFIDAMEYPAAPLFPNADGTPGKRSFAVLKRWTIDLAGNTDTIKREVLNDVAGEFPRVDDRCAGLSYRHGWVAAHVAGDLETQFDRITHVDLKAGRKQEYVFAEGDLPGEPVFVSRDAKADEGDGFVLATVYRGNENRSDLAIFDAQNVAKGPLATAALPRRVPFGFHGNWLDASQL